MERARRDAEIASKKKDEGNADEQDERMAVGMKADTSIEESTWVRGANVIKSEAREERLDRPAREQRDGQDEGGFLTRSEKPSRPIEEALNKPLGRPTFSRGAKKEEEGEDAGIQRSNFTRRDDGPRADDASRGDRGGSRGFRGGSRGGAEGGFRGGEGGFRRGGSRGGDGADAPVSTAGFGFRNTNMTAKK